MTVLALAFVIGVLNGLRSFTPPAAVAWAAHLRWIKLQGAPALIGSIPVVAIFTLLAAFELVVDKMPWIPDRTTTMSLIARGVMGALTGACVAAAGGQWAGIGAVCGVAGAAAGAGAVEMTIAGPSAPSRIASPTVRLKSSTTRATPCRYWLPRTCLTGSFPTLNGVLRHA